MRHRLCFNAVMFIVETPGHWQKMPCHLAIRALSVGCIIFVAQLGSHQMAPAQAQGQKGASGDHAVIQDALRPVKSDLGAILERRLLRVAIPYTPIYFSYNGEEMIGFAVEMARELEVHLEETLDEKVDVLLVPLPRDQIIPAVVEGRTDLAMANLTITEQRKSLVDFADPIFRDISEIVVTGPASPDIQSLDDLVETGLALRPSSSYFAHLQRLNTARETLGRAPVPVVKVAPHLEDYDLLDLLDTGVISATVVDSHKLELWRQVFERIVVHDDLTLNQGGEIAWAVRKGSPELLKVVNGFISQVRQGTLLGNILSNRYFGSADWINEIRRGDTLRKRDEIIQHIQTYSGEYDFDWRLIFAQAYQESRLVQDEVSSAGAIGVMQILPATASDPNVSIPDIRRLENNIHAGIKYLSFIRNRYFDDPEISAQDKTFLSLAAYNAGPRNISEARRRAKRMGLDPNVWFANVEIAAARIIGREPVVYVRNIYKNFVSYGLINGKAEVSSALPDPDIGEEAKPGSRQAFPMLAGALMALLCLGASLIVLHRFSRR